MLRTTIAAPMQWQRLRGRKFEVKLAGVGGVGGVSPAKRGVGAGR